MTYSLMKSSPKVEVEEKAGPHTPSIGGAEEALLDRRLRGRKKAGLKRKSIAGNETRTDFSPNGRGI